MSLCAILLAVTPNSAQTSAQTSTRTFTQTYTLPSPVEPSQSIISLASSPRPQGELLARHPGDATFEHAPANYHVFSTASVGVDAGVEALTLNFAGETRLTRIESKNKDFVIEPGGTCHEGNSYGRGGSCTLLVRFDPQGPGHRLGFINVSHTAEATPNSFGLVGNGYVPVVSFTPSQITSIPSSVSAGTGTIKSTTNLGIDGGDILYIPDTGNNKLKEMDSTGNIVATALGPIATPVSAAADSFGDVYTTNTSGSTYYFSVYYPWGSQTAYGYAYAAGACTPSAPCAFSAVGMNSPANMSIDAYNDLFFEEGTHGAAEMPVGSISGGTGTFNLWYLSDQFSYSSGKAASFASDAQGNIYTKYSFSTTTCYLLEESLYNAEYSPTANRVAGGIACGFSGDGGQARSAEISSTIGQIAFDVYGNLYFADAGNQRVRRIDSATGIISTIAGNGTAGYSGDTGSATLATLSNPTGVAVDSQGQVYIVSNAPTAGPTQAIRKVGTYGFWVFSSQLRGSSSAPKVFQVANTGNTSLVLSANAFFTGTNPGDYAVDPATTSCVLTTGAVLAAGRSCNIGIVFKPSAAGSRTAQLVMMDNTVLGTNSIHLGGTGTLPAPTMTITSPVGGSSVKTGTIVTFAVSVTSASTTKPTGTVTFKVNGSTIGSPVTLSSTGTASTTFSESTANTYTLSAVYSGDANYATTTATESLIVTTIKLPVLVTLTTGARPLSACTPPTFSVQVSSASGGAPTGTVQLRSDAAVLESVILTNGTATLSPASVSPGSHSFTAAYGGDALHQSGTSAPVTVTVPTAVGACTGGHPPIISTTRSPVVN